MSFPTDNQPPIFPVLSGEERAAMGSLGASYVRLSNIVLDPAPSMPSAAELLRRYGTPLRSAHPLPITEHLLHLCREAQWVQSFQSPWGPPRPFPRMAPATRRFVLRGLAIAAPLIGADIPFDFDHYPTSDSSMPTTQSGTPMVLSPPHSPTAIVERMRLQLAEVGPSASRPLAGPRQLNPQAQPFVPPGLNPQAQSFVPLELNPQALPCVPLPQMPQWRTPHSELLGFDAMDLDCGYCGNPQADDDCPFVNFALSARNVCRYCSGRHFDWDCPDLPQEA